MKKITTLYISIFLLLTFFTGCRKWFDVAPSDQVSADKLFQSPSGFHNALTGIYQMMADKSLYGSELTWGMNSALGQDYRFAFVGGPGFHMGFLRYGPMFMDFMRPTIDKVWENAYHAIANCNKLVVVTGERDSSFFQMKNAEKEMILGEAIAARALLHFELLKLYAPSLKADPEAKILPYVDQYPSYVNKPVSSRIMIEKIIADLQKAQALVARLDTIVFRDLLQVNPAGLAAHPQVAAQFSYRRSRLNFVAIHGLLARVYLYAGDLANAKKAAAYVYDNYSASGRLKWWNFNQESDFSSPDRKDNIMSNDLLFALYDNNLNQNVRDYRQNERNTYALHQDYVNWYPSSERDFRKYLVRADFSSEKWNSVATFKPQTSIPVLRMSEIYFIYSEALFKEGNQEKALKVLNEVRIARGMNNYFFADNETDFYTELLAEYRREFVAEGQTYFAYKRLNRNIVVSDYTVTIDNSMVMPVPDGEKVF